MRRVEGSGLPTSVIWVATLLVLGGAAALLITQIPNWTSISTIDRLVAAAPLVSVGLLLTSLGVTWREADRSSSIRARRAADRVT